MKKLLILLFILTLLFSCTTQQKKKTNPDSEYAVILKKPERQLESYAFNSQSSIESRVEDIPDFVLQYLIDMDQKPNYKNYSITDNEKNVIKQSIEKLPPLHKKILKERLLGIYFVENFLGSGFTDWVLNENKNVFCFLVYNPDVLKYNISKWVTIKEKTCYINNSQDIDIQIDCGIEYSGFFYILLHEATHVVDYVKVITPYVEDVLAEILKLQIESRDFTENIWREYALPLKANDYNFRKNITFYGFGGGPKINITDAITVYKQLEKTLFPSLYASKSWAEDLAEFLTFYHLTQKLNQPYIINILEKNKVIYTYKPMNSEKVKKRFPLMEQFY